MALIGPTEASTAAALLAMLADYFAAVGVADVEVIQAQQPTQQGQYTGDALYFQRLHERRYGWPQRLDVFDQASLTFVHGESTQYEVTYQFNAYIAPPQNGEIPARTPADILRVASMAFQSDRGMAPLRAAGLGVLRVTDLRLSYATNEQGQFEPEPSFDVTMTYRNTLTDQVGLVTETELNIFRV